MAKSAQQLAPQRHVELPQAAADVAPRAAAPAAPRASSPATTFGGVVSTSVAQHVGDRIEPLAVGGQPRGIARREARHLALRAPGDR